MKKVRDIPDDEMVGAFLQAEIKSTRWGSTLQKMLERDKKSETLLLYPDFTSKEENDYRRKLLGDARGYGNNAYLFQDFPTTVRWQLVHLTKEELKQIKYIDYDYWNELSGNTRLANDGANNVLKGVEVFGQSNEGFREASEAVKKGVKFPPIILVTLNSQSDLVVLEGHLRITAMLMAYDYLPDEIEVIIGYSEGIIRWGSY